MSILKEYFTYSKKERVGILALLILMFLSVLIYFLIDFLPDPTPPDYSGFKKEIDEFEQGRAIAVNEKSDQQTKKKSTFNPDKKIELFYFDPNTVSIDSLNLLGIYPKVSERIIKYRRAGGKFTKADDLMKIYGMNENKFHQLEPFVQVHPEKRPEKFMAASGTEVKKPKEIINLNNADTTLLKSLNGIGSKLSARIIKFRDAAGGFYSVDQLKDIFGLDPLVIENNREYLTTDSNYKLILINQATAEELKNHPYIRKWNVANAIVNYREKHGNYEQASDLMKTDLVSGEICRKIEPYLIFE